MKYDLIKLFWTSYTHSLRKLDHFVIVKKSIIIFLYKERHSVIFSSAPKIPSLVERFSKFTPQKVNEIDDQFSERRNDDIQNK